MLRFLVFFRYGMSFHGPRIGDHVESERKAFERIVTQAATPVAPVPRATA